MRKIVQIVLLGVLLVSCGKASTPKPYGYYRITVPDTVYSDFAAQYPNYPYTFALSQNAVVKPRLDAEEPYWINLFYPALDATIHCSYKPVRHNLRELTNDALEFVYRNASFANAIPEQDYTHPEARVYGVLFDLEGNTASSCQFFITDSTTHFFRASVYCNCPPNADWPRSMSTSVPTSSAWSNPLNGDKSSIKINRQSIVNRNFVNRQ